MRKKAKEGIEKNKIIIISAVIVLIILSIFILKKTSIAGYFALTEEDNAKQLFDLNVQVLPDYKRIFQGDDLLIQVTLFNLRGFESVDVKYSIKDTIGNVIAAEEEVVAVETQAKFVRKVLIPPDLKPGTYAAFVEVRTSDDLIETSFDLFEVTAKYEEEYPVQIKYLAGAIILAVIAVFAVYLFKKAKKKKEVIEFKEKVPEEKIQKLEKELKALESAYKSKFISEASYKKAKERIENKLRRLKGEKPEKFTKSEEKTAEEIVEEVKKEDEKYKN